MGLRYETGIGKRRWLALATLAAAAPAAHAQDTDPQAAKVQESPPPARPPRASVGIAAQPLTLGVRHDVLYDDDVVQGSAEAAQRRGLVKSEFIVTPSATVDFGYNDGRFGVAVNGVFGYDFHEKNTVLNRERLDFSGSATALVGSSCAVTAKYVHLQKQTRQQDLTLIVTANRVVISAATLGQTCTTSGGFTETVQVLSGRWHNSSSRNINNDRKAVSTLVGYTDPALGTIGVTFLYERTDFFGLPAFMVMTPDTLEKTNVGLQYASPVDRKLSGTLAVGYVYSDATAPVDSGLAGPRERDALVAQGTLLYKPDPRLSIAVQAARKIRHDTSFTITTDLQLAIDYALAPGIRASAGGRWLRDRYFGRDLSLPQIYQDRQDQSTIYGTLTFRVADRTTLSADVRHDIGRASFAPFDYEGTRFLLTLSSAFGSPFD